MKYVYKYFSIICLLLSLLLVFYIFFKSQITWNGEKNDYYFKYFVISIVLIISSLITFFINNKIKEYLFISFVTIILSLYIIESLFIFGCTYCNFESRLKGLFSNYETRTLLEFYEDNKVNDKSLKVMITPVDYLQYYNKNDNIFPLSGFSNTKTIFCNENGYFSIFESDRYGFNNPDEQWDSKEISYLFIGDSFTEGACVNRPNDVPSVFRKLTGKSVLNLGKAGNSTLLEYATLREYLDTNVKNIVLMYYEGNDLRDLNQELSMTFLNKYLNDNKFSQNLRSRQNEVNKLINKIIENEINKRNELNKMIKDDSFYKFIKLFNVRALFLESFKNINISKVSQSNAESYIEFKKILKLINSLSIENGSKLYFVYLPEYSRYKYKYENSDYIFIKKLLNDLDIPIIDIHKEVIDKENNPIKIFSKRFGHYNILGYEKVANAIYKSINEHKN